jgi:alkylated DNA nucleotide flippase Atl1
MKSRTHDPLEDAARGLPLFARRVLDLVDAIPAGRVMSYGQVAAYLGNAGPRMVARVMATWGDGVPWWRVVRADGSCAPEVTARQSRLLRRERVAFRSKGRVDMDASRYTPPE